MFVIRAAQADDLDAIHLLLKAGELPVDDVSAPLLTHFFVFHDGPIAGCVGIEPHGEVGLLRSLAVADSIRGKGWGQRLLQAAEAHARNLGIANLYLLTKDAAPFFEAHAYRRVERRTVPEQLMLTPQFAGLCPASATCLAKTLDPDIAAASGQGLASAS